MPAKPFEDISNIENPLIRRHGDISFGEGSEERVRMRLPTEAGFLKSDKPFCDALKQGFPERDIPVTPRPHENAPIVYRYLDFETELPSPTILGSCRDCSPTPTPPDLRNYVSPFTWSDSRKNYMTWLSCAVTVVTAYTAGSYSPASQQLSDYWHISQTATLVGITMFTTGFAVAPMFLAPFSELNGRRPVFIATGILFVICQLCCAVTRSYPGMLLARFFAGVGGSTFSTMVGGVISDLYHTRGEFKTSYNEGIYG